MFFGEKTVPTRDEAELVQRACEMDHAAISTLYRRHVQAVYQYIYRRVGDPHVAQDLTSEVFLRAIEGLPGYQLQGVPFRAWLYRIAYARVADHFRRQYRIEKVPMDDQTPCDQAPQSAALERALEQKKLWDAIARLTLDQRRVIVLKFVHRLSNAEAARVLGKTEGAVKSLQYRALNALHRLMQEKNE